MGFTKTPLTMKALKYRLTKMKVAHFGMATVCPPGFSANPMWKRKPGQRQCLKDKKAKYKKPKYTAAQIAAEPNPMVQSAMMKGLKVRTKKMTLKDLQKLAKANDDGRRKCNNVSHDKLDF